MHQQRQMPVGSGTSNTVASPAAPVNDSKENPAEKRLQQWMQDKLSKYNENQAERTFTIPFIGITINFGRKHDEQMGILAVLFDLDLPQKALVEAEKVKKYKSYTFKQKVAETESLALRQLERWGITQKLREEGNLKKMKKQIQDTLLKEGHVFGRIMLGILFAIYNDPETKKLTTHRMSLIEALKEAMKKLDSQYQIEQLPQYVKTPSEWLNYRLGEEYKGKENNKIQLKLEAANLRLGSNLTISTAEVADISDARILKLAGKFEEEHEEDKAGALFAKLEREKFIAFLNILDEAIKDKKSHDQEAQIFLEKTLCDVYQQYGRFIDMTPYTPYDQVKTHANIQINAVNKFPDAGDLRKLAQLEQSSRTHALLPDLPDPRVHIALPVMSTEVTTPSTKLH